MHKQDEASAPLTPWTAANCWCRSLQQPGFGILIHLSSKERILARKIKKNLILEYWSSRKKTNLREKKRKPAKKNENPPKQVKRSMPWDGAENEDAYALGLRKLKMSMLWGRKHRRRVCFGTGWSLGMKTSMPRDRVARMKKNEKR